jgi:threonine dehydrogenase-like Zn-dependent dehydrogenase
VKAAKNRRTPKESHQNKTSSSYPISQESAMATMNAIRKVGNRAELCRTEVPRPGPGEVQVRVETTGVCRTDLFVARGQLSAADGVVLGHEFAGVVSELGDGVTNVRRGDRVAVLPLLSCGTCAICNRNDSINCPRRRMLGVDRDGAFAAFAVVPAALAHPLPASVPFAAAAYAEPIAAALGVLNVGLSPQGRGLVMGGNRFAVLIGRLLRLHGFADLVVGDEFATDEFDFVIETGLSADTLERMTDVVRPGGTLVLRSRRPGPFALDVLAAVTKQLTIRAAGYGPFRRALGLLVEGALSLDGLLGPTFPLEDFAVVFDRAERDEGAKLFFDPWT